MSMKILVNGAQGKMGKVTVNAIQQTEDLELVAQANKEDDLMEIIQQSHANIVVDFTPAAVAFENAKKIIEANAHPVIGSSGINADQVTVLKTLCKEKKLGGIIAPNFSIGAVLMMQFAKEAAKQLPHVEIIEYHHNQKPDAPSGTAIKTAEMISEVKTPTQSSVTEKETIDHVRGGKFQDINIHSIRLPGLFAHQEVIFGNTGETLTLRHDANDRQAMMPGVILACRKVNQLTHLVYGLEMLIFGHD